MRALTHYNLSTSNPRPLCDRPVGDRDCYASTDSQVDCPACVDEMVTIENDRHRRRIAALESQRA